MKNFLCIKIPILTLFFFTVLQSNNCSAKVSTDNPQLELAVIRKNTEIVRKVNLNYKVKVIQKGETKAEAIEGKVKIIDEHTISLDSIRIPIDQIREFSCTVGEAKLLATTGVVVGAIGMGSGIYITDYALKKIDEPFSQILAIGTGIGLTLISVVPFTIGGIYNLSTKKHYNLYQYDLVVLKPKNRDYFSK